MAQFIWTEATTEKKRQVKKIVPTTTNDYIKIILKYAWRWKKNKSFATTAGNVTIFKLGQLNQHVDDDAAASAQDVVLSSIASAQIHEFLLFSQCLHQDDCQDCIDNLEQNDLHFFCIIKAKKKYFSRSLTCSIANDMAMAAAQIDLSSRYQVISSTHPLLNACPVTVSRHSSGNGWRSTR